MTSPLVTDPTLMPIGPQQATPVIMGTPSGLAGGGTVLLYNTDEVNTAYAGYSNNITPNGLNVVIIPPLGSITMDASRTIWAIAAVPLILQVVPGATTISPSPAQIIGQLIDSTLPALIAAAVSSAGVPPIDDPIPLLIIFQQNIAAGGTFTSGKVNVSRYMSWVGTLFSAATSAGLGTVPFTKMTIDWSLSADNYDPLQQQDWVVPNTPYNFTYVYRNDCDGPMYGSAVEFTFTNYDTQPCLVTFGFFGSYRTRSRTDIRGRYMWNADGTPNDNAGLGSDGIISSYSTGAITTGNTSTPALMNLINAPVVISGSAAGASAGNSWEVEIQPMPPALGSAIDIVGNGQQISPALMMLPRRVCTIAVHNSGANTITASQIVVISQEQPM